MQTGKKQKTEIVRSVLPGPLKSFFTFFFYKREREQKIRCVRRRNAKDKGQKKLELWFTENSSRQDESNKSCLQEEISSSQMWVIFLGISIYEKPFYDMLYNKARI